MKRVHISKYGRSGNNLFQYMLALYFQRTFPEIQISCNDPQFLQDFGIRVPFSSTALHIIEPHTLVLTVDRHDIDISSYLNSFSEHENITLHIRTLCCRMDIFFPLRDFYRKTIPLQFVQDIGYADDQLLIHIRLEDILDNCIHKNYPPLPFAFYRWILKRTGLQPVFMGQIAGDEVSLALRTCFPNAVFHPSEDLIRDFERIRMSKHIVTSISTFSYIASFLADARTCVHIPLYGMFNPSDRSDCCFVAEDKEGRYHYYAFPSMDWTCSREQIDEIISEREDRSFREILNIGDWVHS